MKINFSLKHVVTRKVGNSIGISLPASFNVDSGAHYLIHQTSNGSIVLVPYIQNPYTSEEDFERMESNEQEDWEQMGMHEMYRDDKNDQI
ncbi:AbrB/MazE/SpoVT family DNA-binding domain-containing protein [Lactobacillus sp.]|uniref:type II toxin-antitoxin system PemI/MazE family antitoxin n=1 Tax=Lactobacillus sp. TaxID=1591 RepID=UPI00199FB0A0|nr:AbrB/MazE/SpoVT family DNA-binding domain-containing protein [Lactobacillus sp.]MBD5430643.1 AbrB/MazE/SpoVT family DNA-binding domain-containing protein [Lactobacillus sp.]